MGTHMAGTRLASELIIRGTLQGQVQKWRTFLVGTQGGKRNTCYLVNVPWGRVRRGSFPEGRALGFHSPYTTACNQIWGRQALGETCHRGSPGPRQLHKHLNSCSHSTLAPSSSQALGVKGRQWRKGCYFGLLLGRAMDACMSGG